MTSRLASMLVQDGRVSAKRMADAFQRQVIFGGTLDTILLEMGLLELPVLLDYLVRASGLPLCDELPAAEAADAVASGFNVPMAEQFHAVPLGRGSGGRLRVLVLDLPDRQPPEELEAVLGRSVEEFIGPEYRFHLAAERLYRIDLPPRFAKLVQKLEAGASDARQVPPGPSLFAGKNPLPGRLAGPPSLRPLGRGPEFAPGAPPPLSPGHRTPREPIPAVPARSNEAAAAPPLPRLTPPMAPPAPSLPPASLRPRPPQTLPRSVVPSWPAQLTPPPLAVGAALVVGGDPRSLAVDPSGKISTIDGLPPVFEQDSASERRLPAMPDTVRPQVGPAARTPSSDAPDPPTVRDVYVGVPERLAARAEPSEPRLAPPLPSRSLSPRRPDRADRSGRIGAALAPAGYPGSYRPDLAPTTELALSLAEGMSILRSASDRDAVFELLCRMARSRFAFAAMFVVQRDQAALAMALDAAFHDRAALRSVEVPLAPPSPLRTASRTLSPYIGRLGDDDLLGGALRSVGRRVPVWGALLPIALRGRCVAQLCIDDGERVVGTDDLAGLMRAVAEAVNSFTRIIQAQKWGAAPATLADTQAVAPPPAFVAPRPARPTPAPVAPLPRAARPTPAPTVPPPPAATIADLPTPRPPPTVTLADLPITQPPPPVRPSRPTPRPTPLVAPPLTASDPGRITDLPTSPTSRPVLDAAAIDRLIQLVEKDDPATAPAAAARLVAAAATTARAVAERFPGVLRFAHRKLHGVGLPLGEHGALLAVAARLGTPMVAPLVERLADPSPDVRFYATLVLAEIHPEAAVAPLSHHLFDPDAAVRRATAYALSRQPPSPPLGRLLEQIREELASDDLGRQRTAAAAAGELRDVAAVPKLIDLLTHRDMEVVDLSHRALVVISKQDFGTARWRWRSWWEKARVQSRSEWLLGGLEHASAEVRRSAIEELSGIGGDRLGCHARLSRRERDDTARRYAEWLERHPGALDELRG